MLRRFINLFIGLAMFAPLVASALPIECQCVLALRTFRGVNIRGDASTIKANWPLNEVGTGDVLLLQYGKVSHTALVIDKEVEVIDENPYITRTISVLVEEWNYVSCERSVREIMITDSHIRGVYKTLTIPAL